LIKIQNPWVYSKNPQKMMMDLREEGGGGEGKGKGNGGCRDFFERDEMIDGVVGILTKKTMDFIMGEGNDDEQNSCCCWNLEMKGFGKERNFDCGLLIIIFLSAFEDF
jgi:hypothetical protein